jgi:hypothetical protein
VLGGVVVGASAAGMAGGAAAGAIGGAEGRRAGLGRGAGFLAATLALAFFGAALTAFFATFDDLPVFFAFDITFAGFFFAALLAAGRLAFAIARFFDLLFFAMVTLLLEIVRTRSESSPEKVRCHLCVKLESVTGIA